MTEKQIIEKVLIHFITIAEVQTLEQQKTTALRANDYEGANVIFHQQKELQSGMLTLDQMKEMRDLLTLYSDTHEQ
jgi:hypothetical protein